MAEPARINPRELKSRMESPDPPLLVLGYEDEESFRKYAIDGAIPFGEFKARASSLPRDRGIVFYCA